MPTMQHCCAQLLGAHIVQWQVINNSHILAQIPFYIFTMCTHKSNKAQLQNGPLRKRRQKQQPTSNYACDCIKDQ